LFVENDSTGFIPDELDFTTTQKKDIFPDKIAQEFGVNLGESLYDDYSPVEVAPAVYLLTFAYINTKDYNVTFSNLVYVLNQPWNKVVPL
jgi:hypothetical protein